MLGVTGRDLSVLIRLKEDGGLESEGWDEVGCVGKRLGGDLGQLGRDWESV